MAGEKNWKENAKGGDESKEYGLFMPAEENPSRTAEIGEGIRLPGGEDRHYTPFKKEGHT